MPYGTVNADVIQTSTSGGILGAGNASIMKNRIINGAMQVWQRGTSSTAIGYQTADRWSFYADSSRTVAQSTDVPSGFTYSASLSGTGSTGFTQKVESVNTIGLVGNSITISFWLKQTTGAGTNAIALNLYYANSKDDWNASTQISTSQNFTTTTGWAQYSATFSSLPSGAANGLQVTIVTTSGSAVVFLLTGVQLELGSSATGFEYVNYQTSLANCQRYFQTYGGASANDFVTIGATNSTSITVGIIQLPVTMRTSPSVGYTSTSALVSDDNGSGGTSTAITTGAYGATSAYLVITTAAVLVNNRPSRIYVNGSSARLTWSAEL